jgi:hypothetical protein
MFVFPLQLAGAGPGFRLIIRRKDVSNSRNLKAAATNYVVQDQALLMIT